MYFSIIWLSCSPLRVEMPFKTFVHVRLLALPPPPPQKKKKKKKKRFGSLVNLIEKKSLLLSQPHPPHFFLQILILCEKKSLTIYPPPPSPRTLPPLKVMFFNFEFFASLSKKVSISDFFNKLTKNPNLKIK